MKLSVFYEHILEAAMQTGKSNLEICKTIHGYGIDGIEIEAVRFGENEEEVMKQMKESGLIVNCVYAFFDFGNYPNTKEGFELINTAKRVGANKVLIIPGFIKENESVSNLLNNMKQALIEIVRYAKSQGITVGMEDFDDRIAPFATTKQLLWFMENVTDLTCVFDTGNFLYSEEDVCDAFEQLKNYIGHVHCKDRSFEEKEGEEPKLTIEGRKMYSSPVGYGCIPLKKIITELVHQGYSGSYAIEHFGSKNQLEDMRISAMWLLDLEKQLKKVEE